VPFPFSDLSNAKLRPAVVLADVGRGDLILCQITSRHYNDPNSIAIDNNSFFTGSLNIRSYVRPGKIFTANRNLIIREVAKLKRESLKQIIEAIVKILRADLFK